MILAALPGIVRELLATGRIVNPGNFGATVNFMGSQLRIVGLARWERTFEPDFYRHLYRLKKWAFNPTSSKRTPQVARVTVDLTYDRIHPELLRELKQVRGERDKPNSKLHQWLTTGPMGGHPRLKQHLEGVVALMSVASNWDQFSEWVDRRYPKYNETMRLPFPEPDNEDDAGESSD
jgi:hypothetical protein